MEYNKWYIACRLLVLVYSVLYVVSATYVTDTFSDGQNRHKFYKLTVDKNTGRVYVGGMNKIYQLKANLVKEADNTTGPERYNPECEPSQPCTMQQKSTDSITTALVIDNDNQRLLVCSNLNYGICDKRHLSNIVLSDPRINVPISPSIPTASVVMFIAPGPSTGSTPRPKVLYVAASYSKGIYSGGVPAVSSRNIATFTYAHKDIIHGNSFIKVDSLHSESFYIRYLYGFSHGGFSYFLSVQKESTQSYKYITKVIRVCQNDATFTSYAEVPLECNTSGTRYNLAQAAYLGSVGSELAVRLGIPTSEQVLYVAFAVSKPRSNLTMDKSAMCLYSMREIRSKFTENIQECFQGIGNTGPDHISNIAACVSDPTVTISDNYCRSDVNNNSPINGPKAIHDVPSIEFPTYLLTSIAVNRTSNDQYTVVFLGTSTGLLLKVVVEAENRSTLYENISIESGNAILSDMDFDIATEHLYVMTHNKVSKVKVEQCDQYITCDSCLGAKDPFCGWCPLQGKCSTRGKCNHQENKGWLPYKDQQCTSILSVSPKQVQLKQKKQIYIEIRNLPVLHTGARYECTFSSQSYRGKSLAVLMTREEGYGVKCYSPEPNQLPAIPTGSDHIVMKLSVSVHKDGVQDDKGFVSTNFTFFDCTKHQTCTDCTNTTFPCRWCVESHRCTSSSEDCGQETIITAKNVNPSSKKGPGFCPRIIRAESLILVASETREVITVEAENLLPAMKKQDVLECVFTFPKPTDDVTRIGHFNASPNGRDRIDCEPGRPVTFQYTEDSLYQNVPLKITWDHAGTKKELDNPRNIQVQMYKCSKMATSCGECLTEDPKFHCGWCQSPGQTTGSKCSIARDCDVLRYSWLNRDKVCPNPRISEFTPDNGPVGGGTSVTITGSNLGKVFSDIENGVSVGGEKCTPIRALYKPATSIVCQTGKSSLKSGVVRVIVDSKETTESSTKFKYVLPLVTSVSPSKGQKAGGTVLSIVGEFLNAGSQITVNVGPGVCTVIQKMPRKITCRAPPLNVDDSAVPKSEDISLHFDNTTVKQYNSGTARNIQFQYVHDPVITKVMPIHGILNGGIKIMVSGSGLDSVQRCQMVLHVNAAPFYSDCSISNKTDMLCPSPNVTGAVGLLGEGSDVQYHFLVDGVRLVTSGARNIFKVYPNPTFENFTAGFKVFQRNSEYLTINGRNLRLGMSPSDVEVRVGTSQCNVTSIASSQLTCKPPRDIAEIDPQPLVTVIVGGNLTFAIGRLRFNAEGDEGISQNTITYIAIGAGSGAFLLILIIVVVFIMYKRKSKESDRVMKHMQTQMDVLECRVAKECKEAFAELQTDMSEITSDITGLSGIPFHSYKSFSMRVLFPSTDENEHPVMKGLEVGYHHQDFDRGIRLFSQLIGNKTFLLLFIRTLESNKYFSMRDRVNVASLISVALQSKMEYHTDILKTLLAELIEKSVEGKSHPKLLLRRTESVAEKMLTNWFTFLLYKFLKECAGEPLFMLFLAIKQQVDKGPVDSLTGEARYSLSEDKLIRQTIDFKVLTLNILDMDIQYGNQVHQVRVLDCDTITQVKDKILDAIYKNSPFSKRPCKEELDLEWRTGDTGRIILQDNDVTSQIEGEWKQLNTLAHYKVQEGALMTFIPRQYAVLSSEKSYSGSLSKYMTPPRYVNVNLGTPPMSRTTSPHSVNVELESRGIKQYHLVKQHDTEREKEGDRGSKMVSEIYLTRLLTTKGTLQQFVDDLFETIFSITHRGSALPLAIKYMFDFLDDQALHHGITDTEVVHTWKSNSLPLRFWVNVIKNPNFVFDIHKSNIVDSCLSVVAQTFMDSCSMSEHRLGKDSPSSKLLYAKEIPKYKTWVERYYQDIKLMPAISDQDMNAMLAEESRMHQVDFNIDSAIHELYQYAVKYNDQILQMLDEDEFARKNKLSYKLEQVHSCMDSEV